MLTTLIALYVLTVVVTILIVVYIARTDHLTISELLIGVLWAAIPVANITLMLVGVHLLAHSSDPLYHFHKPHPTEE